MLCLAPSPCSWPSRIPNHLPHVSHRPKKRSAFRPSCGAGVVLDPALAETCTRISSDRRASNRKNKLGNLGNSVYVRFIGSGCFS